jgi:hypothetical protein
MSLNAMRYRVIHRITDVYAKQQQLRQILAQSSRANPAVEATAADTFEKQ